MAKTKKVANPQKAQLKTAVAKIVKQSVLPILEDIFFLPGKAIVYDLETAVVIPFEMKGVPATGVCIPAKKFIQIIDIMEHPSVVVDKNFGCSMIEGARTIKVMGDSYADFPIVPDVSNAAHAGDLNAEKVDMVKTALLFVSNDDLRPAMTGVYFSKDIVATDAHRMYSKKIGFTKDFIVPQRSLNAMLALGGEWKVYYVQPTGKDNVTNVQFVRNDGTQIICRAIDARFPNYKAVIPEKDSHTVTVQCCPHILSSEIKNAQKFANRSTSQVLFTIKDNSLHINSQDVDFSEEYDNEFPATIIRHDRKVTSSTGEESITPHCGQIAFNAKFMLEIIAQHIGDGPVDIKFWQPTKCAIINKHFLLMPLMLNQ